MAKIVQINKLYSIETKANTNHSFWEIIYCRKGDFKLKIKSKTLSCVSGQFIIIPPDSLHKAIIQNNIDIIRVMLDEFSLPIKTPALFNDNDDLQLGKILDCCLRDFILTMIGNKEDLNNQYSIILSSILEDILHSKKISDITVYISNQILSNYTKHDFDLDEVYNHFDLSKDYIRRYFIKENGVSPVVFLNKLRIDHSIKLLNNRTNTNYKINKIANDCGFADQLYFSRVFSKMVGMSPKKYSEMIAEKNEEKNN